MGIRIERMQPGELEDDINPEDYGFEVIDVEIPSDEETAKQIGRLYRAAKERTGMVIPELEPYLASVGGETANEGSTAS
jgi:hypothetical protein